VRTAAGIAAGGALAALARLGLGRLLDQDLLHFPWATFVANASGCFLIGLLAGLAPRLRLSPALLEAIRTGFLGGFTTFSAFSAETIGLAEAGRIPAAALYALGSIAVGYSLALLGLRLGRRGDRHA